ncbi:MAG: transketolase [Lentisphaerae bacterium]|nr:transketolase [Lentisphaerota bacterium]
MAKESVKDMMRFAARIRLETIRELAGLGFGHVGGAMSVVELLAVLYGGVMRIDPARPDWEERDWLVCSKGHAGPALYAALALKGYFPMEMLSTLNRGGTSLPSHCDRNRTPGVDMTTGSLGQGMSTAIGVALGNRLDNRENWTYLILGDGELDEGQVWEGALFASHFRVDHLIVFVDRNKQQLDGCTKDIMNLGDVAGKFKSFGWHTQEADGHDPGAIRDAVQNAKEAAGRPSVIVLDTVKGKGCTFAEGVLYNHHMSIREEEGREAVRAAEAALAALGGKGSV